MTWLKIVATLALVGSIAYGGWYLRGLKADRDIAEIRRENAEAVTKALKEETSALLVASKNMRESAVGVAAYRFRLSGALGEINENLKRIRTPLAADCRPDDARMRALEEAVQVLNRGLPPGP